VQGRYRQLSGGDFVGHSARRQNGSSDSSLNRFFYVGQRVDLRHDVKTYVRSPAGVIDDPSQPMLLGWKQKWKI